MKWGRSSVEKGYIEDSMATRLRGVRKGLIAGSWLGGAQAGSHDVLMWERSGRRIHLRRLLQADDVRQKGGGGKGST